MKTKVLILGGSSFAGSNFINFLSQKKKYKIIGTYNSKKNLKKLIFKNSLKKFKLIRLNLDNEKNSLLKIVKSFKPKYIFDFASVCMVNESWDDPNHYLKVNLNSKIDFIQNMHNLSFIKKFIYVGTPEVFGSTLKPVKENSLNFNPSTPYVDIYSYEVFNVGGVTTGQIGNGIGNAVTTINTLPEGDYYIVVNMPNTPFCTVTSGNFTVEKSTVSKLLVSIPTLKFGSLRSKLTNCGPADSVEPVLITTVSSGSSFFTGKVSFIVP